MRPPRPLGRVPLVLFFAAGIAGLGLLAGGEHRLAGARGGADPMAGYYRPGMPRYPGAQEVPAGPRSRVGGSALRMSFFATEDDPDKVARFYLEAWRARRFFVREDVSHRGGVVSAVDAVQGLVFQVLLQTDGRRTLVFPSETAAPMQAGRLQEPPPLPLFPDSQVLITQDSREGVAEARLHLSVNEGGLEANLQHYRREARAAGYQIESDRASGPAHHMLVLRRGSSELTLDLSLGAGKRVRVHLMEVGS